MPPIAFAFLLTVLAGLSTTIGAAISLTRWATRRRFLAASLGFSAGVMLYVSFVEILPAGQQALSTQFGTPTGGWLTVGGFFGGIALIAVIDRLVPHEANPHEMPGRALLNRIRRRTRPLAPRADHPTSSARRRLLRTGLFTGAAMALHNFPEGFATFLAGIQAPDLAIIVAVAIAIHNIPEGIAVAVPIYHATGNRARAFWFATASGLAEPLGALVGYLLLRPFISDALFGFSFAFIAGIMVFVCLDELLPAAEEYGEHHLVIYWLIAGMAIMAISLLLLT